MWERVCAHTVTVMFPDPTSRRIVARARLEELQRHAKPLGSPDQADDCREANVLRRLRRLLPR
jgi:hypothetical protein